MDVFIRYPVLMYRCLGAQVFTVVEQVVYCHTWLLYGRHLDQILLSALYAVCKVNGLSQARTPSLALAPVSALRHPSAGPGHSL